MITTYSFQADFRNVAQRLADDQRQGVRQSEHVRRAPRSAAEERESMRFQQQDASSDRVA
uniref:Uncharacterized protein n=1 Tax=Acidobacterium capsulatum TaxID=33075 RepID=A0A7V4XSV7_9BACT